MYLYFAGHNTDGKYFVTSSKLTFSCELKPRRVHVFTEKTRDAHISPVNDVEAVDIACGQNHTVCVLFVYRSCIVGLRLPICF